MPHRPSVVGLTDVGRTRSRNEDSLSLLPDLGVAVVADGMGGHPGGDVASRVAAETALHILERDLSALSRSTSPNDRLEEIMRRAVMEAHEAIRAKGQEDPELVGMGTTIIALAVDSSTDAVVLGHVGDSRAYRFRDGRLVQLTKDDTWVQERVDAKQITPEQARRHPFAHLLTQCLGLEDAPVPHILLESVRVGDAYLLCTDGLVGMIEDDALAEILTSELETNGSRPGNEPAESALSALISAANEAGGHDNITAALVTIGASSG